MSLLSPPVSNYSFALPIILAAFCTYSGFYDTRLVLTITNLLGLPITTLFLWVKYSPLDKCLLCHRPQRPAHGGKGAGQLAHTFRDKSSDICMCCSVFPLFTLL